MGEVICQQFSQSVYSDTNQTFVDTINYVDTLRLRLCFVFNAMYEETQP